MTIFMQKMFDQKLAILARDWQSSIDTIELTEMFKYLFTYLFENTNM